MTALPLAYLPLTSREKTALLPTVASSDGRPESISFYSPVTSLPENPLIVPIQGSTLGNTMFGVGDTLPPKPLCAAEHAKRATSSNPDIDDRYAHRPRRGAPPTPSDNVAASATLAEQEYYGPLFDPFDPLFDLDFENIPIGHLREVPPPYSSGAFAAFAGMESSSSNPLFTGAARKVHTETNPTVNQARKLINWEDWKQAILAELIALRETGTYEEIKRSAIPQGAEILHTKMDLKMKFDSTGSFTKYKARLVVLGNQESPFTPSLILTLRTSPSVIYAKYPLRTAAARSQHSQEWKAAVATHYSLVPLAKFTQKPTLLSIRPENSSTGRIGSKLFWLNLLLCVKLARMKRSSAPLFHRALKSFIQRWISR